MGIKWGDLILYVASAKEIEIMMHGTNVKKPIWMRCNLAIYSPRAKSCLPSVVAAYGYSRMIRSLQNIIGLMDSR